MTTICLAHIKTAPEYFDFLRQACRSPDLTMVQTSYGDGLLITVAENELTSTDAWNHAATVVRNILGLLNAFANLVGPIEVTAPVSAIAEDGTAETIGAAVFGTFRITSKEGRQRLLEPTPDGTDTILSRIVKLARENPDIDRVLGLLDDRDPSWSDIYLLMEIVDMNLRSNGNFRGKNWIAIAAQGWLPKATIGAIKRNAGYHRHAKLMFAPPRPLLSLDDARRYCKQVVRSWLESIAAG